jgi:2-phospho-L-lactate/phosphoenolpyruvate guanylyltransferase
MILVPVKNLSSAKQRLSAVLDQAARTLLAQAMLRDVITAFAAAADSSRISLVTSDPFALELAKEFSLRTIRDQENRSETAAIEIATQACLAENVQETLVVPADIPLVKSEEVEQIFSQAPSRGSVLVPAADGRGTNAILRRPADLFPLRFGNDSFRPHCAAAEATGLPCRILSLPGIAFDIDQPSDLQELISSPGNNHSQRLSRRLLPNGVPLAVSK